MSEAGRGWKNTFSITPCWKANWKSASGIIIARQPLPCRNSTSRYTPEWEVFYEHETLPPTDFLIFLQRMETAFRKRYTLAELDVSYYIGRLSRLPERSEERAALQELFLDKWHHLLTVKEYDYQYQHLFRLCEGFQILDKSFGLEKRRQSRGSRVKWLLRNHPELYQKVVPYEKAMEQSRQIRDLVRCLGKNAGGRKESFDSLSGLRADSLIRHASQSDVEGVTWATTSTACCLWNTATSPTKYCIPSSCSVM